MFNSILVICTANICRSPVAELLLKRDLPNKQIASAGTHTFDLNISGSAAHESSIIVANEHGLDLSAHQARQVTKTLVDQFELILVMNENQREYMAQNFQGSRAKTLLIGQWINLGEIADPYTKDLAEFHRCFQNLERAVLGWSNRLQR